MLRIPYAVLVTTAIIAALTPLSAQALEKLITVTGAATVEAVPDTVIIHLGVTTQAKTARAASEANARKMTDLFGAMKDGGITERDIQTSDLSLQPQYDENKSGRRLLGFEATNQVRVKVRKVDNLPALLDRAIGAGAHDVSGITFEVSEQSKLLDKARDETIADAHRKAALYAQAARAKLGQVVSITEAGSALPIQDRGVVTFRNGNSTPEAPVAPGEQTLRAVVSVSYELAP